MANGTGPATCEACGRPLPPQLGQGRRRRYCNATCRSRARRQREVSHRGTASSVKEPLTSAWRHDNLDVTEVPEGSDPVAIRLRQASAHLAEALGRPGGSPLAAVAAARELSTAANAALQESVDRARAAGHSWSEIGDVLDTTRQAAFQRFGRPVDPRTGKPMIRDTLPEAADRAAAIFGLLAQGQWAEVCRDFDETMREHLDADRLATGWAQTAGLVGALEGMGEPLTFQVGAGTVVDIPLHFEAGERTGRVSFGPGGKIAGLFIRPASGT